MAISLSGMASKAGLFMKGVNWQLLFMKFTVYATLGLTIAVVAFREGKHSCEVKTRDATITILEKQTIQEREFVRSELAKRQTEITDRLEVIGRQSREASGLTAELAIIKGKLDESIKARPGNPICAPSDDELRYYDQIAEGTHK